LLRYEELVQQPEETLPRVAEFLKCKPTGKKLPSFEELQDRVPGFFRRGNNNDYLALWAPAQMTLFNQLHRAVMEEIGYALVSGTDDCISTAVELAHGAARLHRLYEEQLAKLGQGAVFQQQLSQEITRLSDQLRQVSNQLKIEEDVLNNRWVKLGMAVGAVQTARRTNGGSERL